MNTKKLLYKTDDALAFLKDEIKIGRLVMGSDGKYHPSAEVKAEYVIYDLRAASKEAASVGDYNNGLSFGALINSTTLSRKELVETLIPLLRSKEITIGFFAGSPIAGFGIPGSSLLSIDHRKEEASSLPYKYQAEIQLIIRAIADFTDAPGGIIESAKRKSASLFTNRKQKRELKRKGRLP